MFKKRIALAVISAMATGYRRAGFSLEKGTNELEATEEQIQLLEADKNLTVVAESSSGTEVNSHSDLSLQEQNTAFKGEIISLSNQLAEAKKQLAEAQAITHEDTLNDLAGIDDYSADLDVSSAPEELHHWIAVIDDINKESPLTKKPNCDHLTITVEGEPITPSAAERDAAWEWYQKNVVIAAVNSTTSTEDKGE